MYAPVSKFLLREKGNSLVGYAAPASGSAACLLKLTADGIPIAAARATGFSRDARDASLRLGWCAVELPGLAVAGAVGSRLEVRCGVSDQIIWQRSGRKPVAAPRIPKVGFTVFDIISLSRKADAATSLSEIEPFFRAHLTKFGTSSYVNATYGTFLGRAAEHEALRHYDGYPLEKVLNSVIQTVLGSREFRKNALGFIPGPFNASFRYDIQVIE